MDTEHDLEQLDASVQEFFDVLNITHGSPKQPFISRYRFSLEANSAISFRSLLDKLEMMNLSAVMRKEKEEFFILVIPVINKIKKILPGLNLVMFLLTLISVLLTGGLYGYQGELPENIWLIIWTLIKTGWPFAVSLLAILSAHEFGHYFAGRLNKVDVSLPFFIPFPFSLFGTMGAFINMRSVPRDKKALFDLAITGPLSGAIVSIIVLVIGLRLSEISTIPLEVSDGNPLQMEGNSLLYLFMKFVVFGKLLPRPVNLTGFPLFQFWIKYFFTGTPFPWGAMDVMLHPVAWAGWAGFLVTGLNLIPAGQLDGGHIFYTLFGKKTSRRLLPIIVGGLVAMGFFWNGWWLWAVLIFFFGQRSAETLDQISDLDKKRKIIGYFALGLFILTFIPVPISVAGI